MSWIDRLNATIDKCIDEAVARERKRCAQIAENTEAGDGSHDYNAGAETMQERIVKAIRTAGVSEPGHHTFPQETPPIPEEPQSPTTTGGEKT